MFISIVEDTDIVKWHFVDPDTRQEFESEFSLRTLPRELNKTLRKKHRRFETTRQGPQERFESSAYVDDVLDYAIVAWTGVRASGQDVACTREWKSRLPEVVKAEIIRLCAGAELGLVTVDDAGEPSVADPRPATAAASQSSSIGTRRTES